MTDVSKPRIPAILISAPTQALLIDIFGRPDLFDGLLQVDHRVVAWGKNATPIELPHRAAVISEATLLDRLGVARPGGIDPADADWTIYASHPLPGDVQERAFGSRIASAVPVRLRSRKSACWIESLDHGWLFLIPEEPATGWLISVGGRSEDLLAQSRLVAPVVEPADGEAKTFPAYPRMIDPLCAPQWLACGTAAMTFDPICGDGTGNAIRESILAAAVIRAIHGGEPPDLALAHYRTRLIAGMLRHLELCRTFYQSANSGSWWEHEVAAVEQGIEWCGRQMREAGPFRYRLRGFELEKTE